MSHSCVSSMDLFCYVCGEETLASQRRSITPLIKKANHLYFGYKLGDQDKKRAPHIVCKSRAIRLGGWISLKGMAMLFAVPLVWREPWNHSRDCYFCLTTPVASGMNRKRSRELTIQMYPLPSDMYFIGKTRVIGTAETMHITMSERYGLSEIFWRRTHKCIASFTGWVFEEFVANSSQQIRPHEEFLKDYGS